MGVATGSRLAADSRRVLGLFIFDDESCLAHGVRAVAHRAATTLMNA
jgi:hypothetical protein